MLKGFPLRRFAVSVSGMLLAQGIAFLAQPILRRLYPPEAFGELSLYLSLSGVLSTVAPLRYELALMMPRSPTRTLDLFLGAVLVNTGFSILMFVLFWTLSPIIISLLRLPPSASFWLPLLGLSVWTYGLFLLFQNFFSRYHHYGKVNVIRVLRRLPESVSQAGLAKLTSFGLILGELAGRIAMTLAGACFFVNYLRKTGPLNISGKRLWLMLVAYRQFPIHSFLPTLLNTLALLAPSLVANYHFGSYENGLFDMCLQIVALPVGFISTSVSNVILAEVSERYRQKKPVRAFLRHASLVLASVAFALALALWALGSRGFSILFGKAYGTSAFYALLLLPGMCSRLLAAPLAVTFAGLNKIHQSVWWQYAYSLAILCLFLVPFNSMPKLLITYSLVEFCLNGAYIWQVFRTAAKFEKSLK